MSPYFFTMSSMAQNVQEDERAPWGAQHTCPAYDTE